MLKKDWILMITLFLFALVLRLPHLSGPLETDGADYVMAAQQGFLANYLERGSRPILDFIRNGVTAALLDSDTDFYRQDYLNKDVDALRHYHAPLVIYFLRFFMVLFGSSEAALRLTPLLFGSLLPVILYWGCTRVIQENPRFVGFVAAFLASVTPLLAEVSKYVSWHAAFMVWSALSIFLLIISLQQKKVLYFYASFFFFSLALLTLEYAVLILVTIFLSLIFVENPWLSIKRERITVSTHLFGAILFSAAILTLLWPPALLKLALLKNYAFYSEPFISLLKTTKAMIAPDAHAVKATGYRLGRWYTVYGLFFKSHGFLSVLLLYGLSFTLWTLVRKKFNKHYIPLLLLPVLLFLVNAKVSFVKLIYISHILPFLYIFCGIALVPFRKAKNNSIRNFPSIVLLLAFGFNFSGLLQARTGKDYFRSAANYLKEAAGKNDTIVVAPAGETPVFMYYLPGYDVRFYAEEKDDMQELLSLINRNDVDFFVVRSTENDIRGAPIYESIKDRYDLVKTFSEKNEKRLISIFKQKANFGANGQ